MYEKITTLTTTLTTINIVYNRREWQGPGHERAQQSEGHHLIGARFGQVERREEEGEKVT